MNRNKPPGRPGHTDWDDPHIKSLLERTEHWSLDNRGGFIAQDVQVYIGWHALTARPGRLVYEKDHVLVVETRFFIPKGELVRVERPTGSTLRAVWCMVMDGREGRRNEDRAHGIYVHWLHTR